MNWRWFVVVLFFGLSPRIALAQNAGDVARFAIVIGNNRPDGNGQVALRFADDDAVTTHQLLLDAGIDSHLLVTLDTDSQRLYPALSRDGAPRLSELERVFATISQQIRARNQRGEPTELLLFYSGHGDAENGEGYVVLEDQHLTRHRLFALLQRSPATRNHVFVDACKSYFLIYEKGPGGRRTAYAPAFVEHAVPGLLANTGFVLSTSSDRDSHEWDHYQAGIFSYEVRSALRGAADANQDGQIGYEELAAFLTVANSRIENAKLRPDFVVRPPGSGPAGAILSWKAETAALRLSGPDIGHLYLETTSGVRLLDVHPADGEVVQLHLPKARPLFVRKDDETAEYVLTTERPETEQIALAPKLREIGDKGSVNLALQKLFAMPFGASNVHELERPPPPPPPPLPSESHDAGRQTSVGPVAGWVALGAAGAALTLSTASVVTSLGSKGESQVEIERHNQRVRTLNIASAVGYAIAGAASLTWSLSRLHVSVSPDTARTSRGVLDARGLTVDFEGRF